MTTPIRNARLLTRRHREVPLELDLTPARPAAPAERRQRLIAPQFEALALIPGTVARTKSANRPASADAASSPCS